MCEYNLYFCVSEYIYHVHTHHLQLCMSSMKFIIRQKQKEEQEREDKCVRSCGLIAGDGVDDCRLGKISAISVPRELRSLKEVHSPTGDCSNNDCVV